MILKTLHCGLWERLPPSSISSTLVCSPFSSCTSFHLECLLTTSTASFKLLFTNHQRALKLINGHCFCVLWLLDWHHNIGESLYQCSKNFLLHHQFRHILSIAPHFVGHYHYSRKISNNGFCFFHFKHLKLPSQWIKKWRLHMIFDPKFSFQGILNNHGCAPIQDLFEDWSIIGPKKIMLDFMIFCPGVLQLLQLCISQHSPFTRLLETGFNQAP